MQSPRLHGKVVKRFPDKRFGFVATDTGAHFFFHLSDSPSIRKIPEIGTWVSFTSVMHDGKHKHDRAIRLEVL